MAVVKDEPIFIPTPPQFIAGMQFDFAWNETDVEEFIADYIALKENGEGDVNTLLALATKFNRHAPEVAILIMDLGERGYISPQGKGSNPRPFKARALNKITKGRKPNDKWYSQGNLHMPITGGAFKL